MHESRIGAALSRTICGAICDDRRGEHRRSIRNLACMTQRRPLRGVLALLCAALLVGSGCARFNEAQSEPFTT